MSALLPLALAALEDLRDDYHQASNRAFFSSHFVSATDNARYEQTVRNALAILQSIPSAYPVSLPDRERMAS